jgi:hypothetical protein
MPQDPDPQPKITRLPRNGPKPGQSVDAWLHGKHKAHNRAMDDPRNKLNDLQPRRLP